ncbi:MAG: dTDP-4-dehydrorhamnose 3,5-epimerase family protein [Armatimonadetes bacterium]|nr:dTDP-4-dehydrorhamnose 3,5-epimerase family protein [Armatimonadota bacterium]
MIDGVVVKQLTRHVDERGYLMEVLRRDDELFREFGQAYVSACFPGMIKAWHCHQIQYDHFCCLAGNLKVGLYDDRPDSPTCGEAQTVVIGMLNPALICIPPLVWHGFAAVGNETAVVLNLPTELYNYREPDELRRALDDPEIPFQWKSEGW